jgi:hypothetical protein
MVRPALPRSTSGRSPAEVTEITPILCLGSVPGSRAGGRLADMESSTEGVVVVIEFANGRGDHGRHEGRSAGVVHPPPRQAVNAVGTLRRALGRFELSDPETAEAFRLLAEIEVELRACEPNRGAVAVKLERLAELLSDAGTADLPVVRGTRAIATWVGPRAADIVGRVTAGEQR